MTVTVATLDAVAKAMFEVHTDGWKWNRASNSTRDKWRRIATMGIMTLRSQLSPDDLDREADSRAVVPLAWGPDDAWVAAQLSDEALAEQLVAANHERRASDAPHVISWYRAVRVESAKREHAAEEYVLQCFRAHPSDEQFPGWTPGADGKIDWVATADAHRKIVAAKTP